MPSWAARTAPIVLAALIVFGATQPRAAEPSTEKPPSAASVHEVERALEEARAKEKRLASEAETQIRAIETLRTQLATAARATQESEEQLSEIESRLAGLDAEAAAKSDALAQRRQQLATTIAALTRIARNPPEALALMPQPPLDTVRTARLLGDVVPPIEAEAKQIAAEVADLRALRDRAAAEHVKAAAATQHLEADRARLEDLVARRGALYQQASTGREAAAAQVGTLARQASDMRDLLRRLEAAQAARPARPKAVPPAPAAGSGTGSVVAPPPAETLEARITDGLEARLHKLGEPRGQMVFPARGRILLSYGQAGDRGQPQRGLTIETRPDAQVVAPFDGKIVFAGPFRGYGRILIIEHGEGYHTLLAGLGRIEVSVGQVVATGEPIATTGGLDTDGSPDVDSPADISLRGAAGPVLYVELRRHGQPINPLPWLATSNGKVSG